MTDILCWTEKKEVVNQNSARQEFKSSISWPAVTYLIKNNSRLILSPFSLSILWPDASDASCIFLKYGPRKKNSRCPTRTALLVGYLSWHDLLTGVLSPTGKMDNSLGYKQLGQKWLSGSRLKFLFHTHTHTHTHARTFSRSRPKTHLTCFS